MKPDRSARFLPRTCLVLLAMLLVTSGCKDASDRPGARLYAEHCRACHGERGQGLRQLYPALDQSEYLALRLSDLPCLIRRGINRRMADEGGPVSWRMPRFTTLSAEDISDLVSYMSDRWSHERIEPAAAQIDKWLTRCQ